MTEEAAGDSGDDQRWMQAALNLGERSLGLAAPNPSVGAILVKDGVVVGRAATAPGGRPHAERLAVLEAGEAARGATLYVTLEPCSHFGKTPPCADAVVEAGVARVVSAIQDPNPEVAGQGHARLRAAGIAVTVGPGADQARRDHRGHILRVTEGRPCVTVKLAETADGFAAGGLHDPRLRITGQIANLRVQIMRATHEAIMIGVETALADDPALTVRLPGLDRKPWRVVLDTNLRLPAGSRLATGARDLPTLVIAGPDASRDAASRLADLGVVVTRIGLDAEGHVDLRQALGALNARGVTRVFSEGGPVIAARLIADGPCRRGCAVHRRKAARPCRPSGAERRGARDAQRSRAVSSHGDRNLWRRRHAALDTIIVARAERG